MPQPQIKYKKLKLQKEHEINEQCMCFTLSLESHDAFLPVYPYWKHYLSNIFKIQITIKRHINKILAIKRTLHILTPWETFWFHCSTYL